MRTGERTPARSAGSKMLAADVMVSDVVAVAPRMPLYVATQLMLDRAMPGLPVVDEHGTVVGVLGEHDLLSRLAPLRPRRWWSSLLDAEQLAQDYRRAVGDVVEDVMTQPAPTVAPSADLDEVVRLFQDEAVDVVPVIAGRRMIGAVTRPSLVAALAPTPPPPVARPNEQIAADMQARMAREPWVSTFRPTVDVCGGVVTLWGLVASESEEAALITMARTIPGCHGVRSRLVPAGPVHRYHEMI